MFFDIFIVKEGGSMKFIFGFKQRWKSLMNSTQRKFSRGADNITKIISWARNDNWRRKQKVKKPPKD